MIKDSQEEGFCQTCLFGHLFKHNESSPKLHLPAHIFPVFRFNLEIAVAQVLYERAKILTQSRTLAPRGTLALPEEHRDGVAGSAREASVAIPEGTPWPGQGIRDGVAGSTGKDSVMPGEVQRRRGWKGAKVL
jgi:hypothetical protein